jgi:hypothetical protein
MNKKAEFDLDTAHRYFSSTCFNLAWDLMDKPERTPAEDEEMLGRGMASFWHWKQRPDQTSTNLSVGYWQLSRIYALLGQADNSRLYGLRCMEVSQGEDVPPFFLGYACEALARAEAVAGNKDKVEDYLRQGHEMAEKVKDSKAKKQLLEDLENIQKVKQIS